MGNRAGGILPQPSTHRLCGMPRTDQARWALPAIGFGLQALGLGRVERVIEMGESIESLPQSYVRLCTAYFNDRTPAPDWSQLNKRSFTRVVLSDMTRRPSPSITGITLSSAASTRPVAARLPKSEPPPNSQKPKAQRVSVPVQSQRLDSLVKIRSLDPQHSRGPGDVPVGLLQRLTDALPLRRVTHPVQP